MKQLIEILCQKRCTVENSFVKKLGVRYQVLRARVQGLVQIRLYWLIREEIYEYTILLPA